MEVYSMHILYLLLNLMWLMHNLIVWPLKHVLIFREAGPRRRPSSSVRWRTTRSCTWRWSARGTTSSRWTSASRCWTPPRTRSPSQSATPSCSWSSPSSSPQTLATLLVIWCRWCPFFQSDWVFWIVLILKSKCLRDLI